MYTKNIDKSEWGAYFNNLSKYIEGDRARIDVLGLDIGDQLEVNDVALYGLVYDEKDNILEVALDGIDHLIHAPKKIEVLFGDGGVEAIEIIDKNDKKQIIKLTKPLMISA